MWARLAAGAEIVPIYISSPAAAPGVGDREFGSAPALNRSAAMRHHRLFTLASGDPIVRSLDVIECASIKEANTAAEALSITASLRGYFDDLLSPPRPKRTVKMERVVVSVK